MVEKEERGGKRKWYSRGYYARAPRRAGNLTAKKKGEKRLKKGMP